MKRPNKKQVQFLRIALGMAGVSSNDLSCEIILTVQSEMKRIGGKFSLRDGAKVEDFIKGFYTPKKVEKE